MTENWTAPSTAGTVAPGEPEATAPSLTIAPAPVRPEVPEQPDLPVSDLPAARILVTPPVTQFRVGGGPYTVPVSISGASQLSTVSLTVTFDPSILSARTVQEGSFMRQGGAQVGFTQEVDAEAGVIRITATRDADVTGAAGAGLLAAMLFDTVAPGSVTLTVTGTVATPGGTALALEFSTSTVTAQ